jgi:uncharacterized protein involved in cysteine biosynthesis
MFAALAKSFGQLTDPPVLRVLWKSVGLALLVMLLLVVFLWILLGWLEIFDWGWLDSAVDFVAGIGALIAAWLLFPVAVTAIVGFFLEDVADAVDRRHYPHLRCVPPSPSSRWRWGSTCSCCQSMRCCSSFRRLTCCCSIR